MNRENVCKICGSIPEDGNYKIALCANCRKMLANRPFPNWIKIATVITVLIFISSLIKLPKSLKAGVSFEKGYKAELNGNYSLSIAEYQKVINAFPNSNLALSRLAISYYKNGNIIESVDIIKELTGKKIPSELVTEINKIIDEINKKVENKL